MLEKSGKMGPGTIDGNDRFDRFENEGNVGKIVEDFRSRIWQLENSSSVYIHGFHGKLKRMKRARDER